MLLTLAFFACNDDTAEAVVDTEDPKISLQAQTGETEVFADDQVMVQANITDNLGLERITISVTTPEGKTQVVQEKTVWDFLNDNKTANINTNIVLGTGTPTAGDYIITITAVDKRGNETTQAVTVTVVEADNVIPVLAAIASPTEGQEFTRGEDITITSSAQDNRGLGTVNVVIFSGGTTWYSETFDAEDFGDDLTMFEINEVVTIPGDAPIGAHTLTIDAEDARGNAATTQTVNFNVAQSAGE